MTASPNNGPGRRPNVVRIAAWSAAALLLLLPLIAMQVTDEVNWSLGDFIIAGVLLLGVGLPLELAVRTTGTTTYRWAVGLALGAAFLLAWINGAVGILGSETNDANLLYGGVLAIGIIGALVARFRPRGMVLALAATALAQAAVALGALIGGWAGPESGPFEVVALNGFFVALWAVSAVLFQRAAQEPTIGDAETEG